MSNAYKYQQPAQADQPPTAAERRGNRLVKISQGIGDRFWNGYGRQLMTACTTVTIMLASLGGMTMLLDQGTLAWYVIAVLSFANLLGITGVAALSWRMFGLQTRSKRTENNKRV